MPDVLWRGEDIAWLAGWLEGEGTFFAHMYERRRGGGGFKIGVQAVSTDEDVIRKVERLFGGAVRGPIHRGLSLPAL